MEKRSNNNWAKNHKEQVNTINRNWRQAHKEQWNQIVLSYKKRKAQEMKEKGMIFTYLPRVQRELRTINYLCQKLNINEDQARKLLIENEWNVKKILSD